MDDIALAKAAHTTDIETFLRLAFPAHWGALAARILESGAQFTNRPTAWAPRWSLIPVLQKEGGTEERANVKTVIYRVHDCLHQLWGLPHPSPKYTDQDRRFFMRAQMCGEVAVLSLVEFAYCRWLSTQLRGEAYHEVQGRTGIQLYDGPLKHLTLREIATRVDAVVHRQLEPEWVRTNPVARLFVNDYRPMLELDRYHNRLNWSRIVHQRWTPGKVPRARFGEQLDGLELTLWMIDDFHHLLSGAEVLDHGLMEYNRQRRAALTLPVGWSS